MPFDSRVYRILIASPADVDEEREIAVRVIQEWNDLYSYTRRVVLLPLRWETHTAPEYGTRPQEVINRAIVDQCDLLIGVFWTRVGTPTGVADSGSLEEITRVAKAGKQVMLYFSRVGIDPDRLDLEQVKRLQAFKAETYPNALTESYKSHVEFRDKLAKQLELKVRELQTADNPNQPPPLSLVFDFGDPATSESSSVQREVDLVTVTDLSQLDDIDATTKKNLMDTLAPYLRTARLPIPLAIKNSGLSGVRNLYVELSIRASAGSIKIFGGRREQTSLFSRLLGRTQVDRREDPDDGLLEDGDGWKVTFEWDALQPQRLRFVKWDLFVHSDGDATVEFSAKVFADSFPAPLLLKAQLIIKTHSKKVSLAETLPQWRELVAVTAASEGNLASDVSAK